jgi:hypothetical protein
MIPILSEMENFLISKHLPMNSLRQKRISLAVHTAKLIFKSDLFHPDHLETLTSRKKKRLYQTRKLLMSFVPQVAFRVKLFVDTGF